MNEYEEKLIANYLAGEDVDEELLEACRVNTKLLKDLADIVATERLLKFDAQEDDLFVEEFEARLQTEKEDQFTAQFQEKLAKKQSSSLKFYQIAAAACLILLPVFISQARLKQRKSPALRT